MGREGRQSESRSSPGDGKLWHLAGPSWALDVSRASQEQGRGRETGRVETESVGEQSCQEALAQRSVCAWEGAQVPNGLQQSP